MHHDQPDPNACPCCGAADELRELDRPTRWQPVTLGYDADGLLSPVNYPSTWEVSDDGTDTSYECSACGQEWPTVYALGYDQRVRKALTDHRDHAETRAERLALLADAGRLHDTTEIDANEARAAAFEHALAILAGNGEA